MKFVCLSDTKQTNTEGPADAAKRKEALSAEYRAAKRMGEVRTGGVHLFYRYFIRIKYVSYDEIEKAYLREESGESGEFLLKEYYLMLGTKNGMLHKLRMERAEYAKETLSYLADTYHNILVGFDRLGQSK